MKRIIAIDFGTNNTYLCLSSLTGDNIVDLNNVYSANSVKGIPSAIMYRTKGTQAGQHKFGREAIELSGVSPKKIADYGLEFAVKFKPDIEKSDAAAKASIDFLTFLKQTLDCQNLEINFNDTSVIFSVPSNATEAFRIKLKAIARASGWGDVQLLENALASFYILDTVADVNLQDILHSTILIVSCEMDCDFTIVQNSKIIDFWEDKYFEYQLIDDLFYQWVIDLSQDSNYPLNEEELLNQSKDFYLRCFKCRELKEKFTNIMADNRNSVYEEFFMGRYPLELTWKEFVLRAINYHPSQSYVTRMKLPFDAPMTLFNPNAITNLPLWFERALVQGFRTRMKRFDEIDKVILVHSDSSFPFVEETLIKHFGKEKIISLNGLSDISRGMVRYFRMNEQDYQ